MYQSHNYQTMTQQPLVSLTRNYENTTNLYDSLYDTETHDYCFLNWSEYVPYLVGLTTLYVVYTCVSELQRDWYSRNLRDELRSLNERLDKVEERHDDIVKDIQTCFDDVNEIKEDLEEDDDDYDEDLEIRVHKLEHENKDLRKELKTSMSGLVSLLNIVGKNQIVSGLNDTQG